MSCGIIEDYTQDVLNDDFAAEVKAGRVQWKPVNVEEPANRHYVDEYQLYSTSVVLSLVQDGEEKRWKNLERVWVLVGNEGAFKDYMRGELRTQLGQD